MKYLMGAHTTSPALDSAVRCVANYFVLKGEAMTPARVDETQLGPVLDFMRLLWSVDHSLQSVSKRMEGTLGVTGPQRVVIRMVGQFPSISAGDVAALLHIHPSTLTGVLKRLVARRIL